MKVSTYQMNTNNRIIFCLDFDSVKTAKIWVEMLKNKIKFFKVGWQLFLNGGLDFVKWLKDQNVNVMLDLKFFDIPRTINAVLNRIGDEADYITVHSQYGIMKEISEEFRKKILGVTMLTCFNNYDIKNESILVELPEVVRSRALKTYESGCGGIVLSGSELDYIKNTLNMWGYTRSDFILVVPGIKLDQERNDDQERTSTIDFAFENGADYVVIGRPIYKSKDPIKTVELAQEKISNYFIK